MKAGDLTLDYLGSGIKVDDVGPRGRSYSGEIQAITHEKYIGGFRTMITFDGGLHTIMLKPGHVVELL